jgi:hypothetical protein
MLDNNILNNFYFKLIILLNKVSFLDTPYYTIRLINNTTVDHICTLKKMWSTEVLLNNH